LGEGKYDGVFGVWYGKGPGVDRSGDVFRHANLAGTSPHGGVLALMGDDHTAESSTNAHATEFLFVDTMIPIFNPAGVQELIDYGLYGYALSRFAGTWSAIKCVKDNIESTASVDVSIDRFNSSCPRSTMPPGGLNIRHELDQIGQERACTNTSARAARLHPRQRAQPHRLVGRAQAQGSASSRSASPISTCARRSTTRHRRGAANQLGIRLFKIACPWPLDLEHVRDFAAASTWSSWSRRSAR
jgi:indolepyruvate ferredoxin oxidoreductase